MAADPIVYCLEQLTDYDQFERLCHDLMVVQGYRALEPLGGASDKGRDALMRARSSADQSVVFAYSVREDWRRKLREDCEKVKKHGHQCAVFAFVTTARVSATERDEAVKAVQNEFGWALELYPIERLRLLLVAIPQLVAQHPSIFIPPFFPRVGGLSVAEARDTVLVDATPSDFALAGWLARRLALQGYRVWSAITAPLAGESEAETISALLQSRATRLVSLLSPAAMGDPDVSARRSQAAQGNLLLPATVGAIDWSTLDSKTRALTPARFDRSPAEGLRQVLANLEHAGIPKGPATATLDHRVFAAADALRHQPERVHSNEFEVKTLPERVLRFRASDRALGHDWDALEARWAFRRDGRSVLAFVEPPQEIAEQLGLRPDGDASFANSTIDGVSSRNLRKELMTKAVRALARSRGLCWCLQKRELHFQQSESFERLTFRLPDGTRSHVKAWGERTFWRPGPGASTKYRYALAPEVDFQQTGDSEFRMTIRVHVRITDEQGELAPDRIAFSRRKRLSAGWHNDEWFKRLLAVAQFISGGADAIELKAHEASVLAVDVHPLAYDAPIGINEEELKDFAALRAEAIEAQYGRDEDDESDQEEADDE